MTYKHSFVAIVPAAHLEAGRALWEALGWGPGAFSCQMSYDGSEPATHYGLCTTCTDTDKVALEAAETGELVKGIDIGPVLAVLAYRFDADQAAQRSARYADLAGSLGLVPVQADPA